MVSHGLGRCYHSPDVFKDGHAAEVDIWGSSGYLRSFGYIFGLSGLGDRICNESSELEVLILVTT